MSKPYTEQDIQTLLNLVGNQTMAQIGRIMDRPARSIYRKWLELVKTRRIASVERTSNHYLFTFLNDKAQELNVIVSCATNYDVETLQRKADDNRPDNFKVNYAIGRLNKDEYTQLCHELPTVYCPLGERPAQVWARVEELLMTKNFIG